MRQVDKYDLMVIGGGAAGLTAAKMARGFGKKVALVEKTDRLGGECTWTGCVPSKALIKTAQIAHEVKHVGKYGLQFSNQSVLDTTNVMEHVREVVRENYQSHTPKMIEKLGISLFFGEPCFTDPYTVQVGEHKIKAKKIIIATGSYPFVPPIEGIELVPYLTNETLFDLEKMPNSMIILGGGPIGAEMASALNRLGVQVHLVEMQERILHKEDQELVAMLMRTMQSEGVSIATNMRADKVIYADKKIRLVCQHINGTTDTLQADAILIAVGRRPNIVGLDLAQAGVKTNKNGIIVDNYLRTSARHIAACGDVVGPYLFSHMAWYQAVVATRNLLIPFFKKRVDYNHLIWTTFTAPELASAGYTERKARATYGDSVVVYRGAFDEIDRGITDRATQGMAKFICDKKGRLLGAHILGERAGDIIHEAQLAKVKGIRFADIQSVIHAYPTYAELTWHSAKRAYVDRLERNIFVRMFKKLFGS